MKNQVLQPLHERIMVLEDKPKEKTDGGLLIPEESKDVPNVGKVVGIGENVKNYIKDLKIGDKIMYQKYSGLPIMFNDIEYKFIMANDVVAKIKE